MNKKDIRFSTIVSALEIHFDRVYNIAKADEENRLEEEYKKSEEFITLLELNKQYKTLQESYDNIPFYKWAAISKTEKEVIRLRQEIFKLASKSNTLFRGCLGDVVELGEHQYGISVNVNRENLPKTYTQEEIEARLYLMDGWEDLSFNELVKTFDND